MDEDFRDPIACLFGGDFLVLSMALRQGLGVAHSGSIIAPIVLLAFNNVNMHVRTKHPLRSVCFIATEKGRI
ncbi:hypothetical protein HZ326_6053 [Fusarium oxysporum f. sp. albedinis]|nr:hypothetical protein HZ326_6053 [Fusarium oxysporum f. sp. albedinis]